MKEDGERMGRVRTVMIIGKKKRMEQDKKEEGRKWGTQKGFEEAVCINKVNRVVLVIDILTWPIRGHNLVSISEKSKIIDVPRVV